VPIPSLPQGGTSLPDPRGPLSDRLFEELAQPPHRLGWTASADSVSEEDLQLSLYCLYELQYTGFPEVAPDWDWEPSLLRVRKALEARFEAELRSLVGAPRAEPADVVGQLWELARSGGGPSLSDWVEQHATLEQFRELAKHRSAYQLKEADPHTWAIPRLRGEAKAVMAAIQADEYGNGSAADMHSALFARTMTALGLDPTLHRYLDELPAVTLATTNLITLLGLHRRLRGALVGHLALFEMTSIGPMGRYARALLRLGLPPDALEFYEVHVTADETHQHLAADGMVSGLVRDEPGLAGDVLFGARALGAVERRFSEHVLGCFERGLSSLRPREADHAGLWPEGPGARASA